MIGNYIECLNVLKTYYSKRCALKHTYHIVRAASEAAVKVLFAAFNCTVVASLMCGMVSKH